MSTAFERRDRGSARARGRAATPGEPIALSRPAGGRRGGQGANRAVAARLRARLNRARFVAGVIVGLSILGLVYLTQISHVARYGYLLSDLQRQQARAERENQLLEHQITTARNLNQVGTLAKQTYGMEPLVRFVPTTTAGAARSVAGDGAKGTPQARYITVERPAVVIPTPPPPPARVGLIDRVGRHLIGVGVAVDER